MADSYDQAQQSLQDQQKAYLAAMAQAGSAGQQQVANSIADAQANKNAAVSAALAEAARRGAPAGMLQSIEYQVGSPFDRQWESTKAADLSRQQTLAANTDAGNTVINQAIANIPALRAMSQRQAQAEQFKAQQQQAADALSMQLKNVDLQIAQANRDRALRGGGSGSSSDPLVEQGRALANALKQQQLDTRGFKAEGGDRSNWANAGPKARSVLELLVKSNGDLGGALSDLYLGQQANWADPNDPSKQLVDIGGTKLDTGALESWLRHYYGQA